MEKQQENTESPRGIGKEEQLAKIAAAVNTASTFEANPTATQSMISTFSKNFHAVALDIVGKMDDDQEDLIKKMVEEITKLQTKNMNEFEKAIGKIVGLADKMAQSNNPKLQALGSSMQDQAKEELFKAKGITLTGEKDTFLNRMGREVGLDTDKEPVEKNRQGIAKVARGFLSSSASGFKAGLKESFRPEGGMLDRVLTTDEDKRQRELAKLQETADETGTESLADMFKKVIEEILDQGKKPDSKDEAPASSEQQEDSAGISADNSLAGIAGIGAALVALQSNSDDSLDISKKLLEKMEFLANWFETNGESLNGGGGGGGGGILDTVSNLAGGARMGSLLPSAGALATGAAVTAGVAGVAYGAYKGYTGYQDAKQQEGAANKEIDEKVSRGELTQAQGLNEKDKIKKTARIEKSKAVGEGAGIAAGAAGGALLGATYGSALGPLGTAVGGVGGALVGGFLGGGGGKWLGEKAGEVTNWWKGDSDKASAIDEKVKKGEISKAEGDKLKKQLKPSGKDKIKGAAKGAAMGSLLGPVGMVAGAAYGFFNQDEAKAEAPANPKVKTAVSEKPKAKAAVSEKPKAKAAVEKTTETVKPKAVETVKKVIEPTKKKEEVAPSLDAVDKSIKGKVAEIDPNGRWAKLKDGKIVDPDFPNDADSNNSAAAAYKLSSKAGKVDGKGNRTGDQMSPKKTTGKTETGKNVDGALVEAGTAATKDKMQVNVPPPTVINQGGGGGEKSGPSMTPQGGVGSVRSDDPTWLQYQRKRVAF